MEVFALAGSWYFKNLVILTAPAAWFWLKYDFFRSKNYPSLGIVSVRVMSDMNPICNVKVSKRAVVNFDRSTRKRRSSGCKNALPHIRANIAKLDIYLTFRIIRFEINIWWHVCIYGRWSLLLYFSAQWYYLYVYVEYCVTTKKSKQSTHTTNRTSGR